VKFADGCVDPVAVTLDADAVVFDVHNESVEESGQQIAAHGVGSALVQLAGR